MFTPVVRQRRVLPAAKRTVYASGRQEKNLGEQVADGPKSLAPGKRGAFRTTLVGGGAVIESLEVLVEVVTPKAE